MKKKAKRNHFLSFFSGLLLTVSIFAGIYLIHLYLQPLSILNPFPPMNPAAELPVEKIADALTKTIAALPTQTAFPSKTATQLPTKTVVETLTNTATKTEIPVPSRTPDPAKIKIEPVLPSANVDEIFYTPTPRPVVDYLFEFVMVHEAQPQPSPWNEFVSNPILNCNWFGVGGQVFDYQGNPLIGANVKLGGSYPDTDEFIELYTITEAEHILGDGGYEFKLSSEPFDAVNSFWVQVIDKDGYAISAKAHFSISRHCTVNLIRIDFIQVK